MDNEILNYMSNYCDDKDEEDGYNFKLFNFINNLDINCRYDNIYNNTKINVNEKKEYTFLHINIQGIMSKFDRLINFLNELDCKGNMPDFILLCETFLTETNSSFLKLDGYSIVTKNRINKKGGGVLIMVKDGIDYNICEELTVNIDDEFESIFIKVNTKLNSF